MPYEPPANSPLNSGDYSKINAAKAAVRRAMQQIELAKAAGIDCAQREIECETLDEAFDKLKAVYFPHKA